MLCRQFHTHTDSWNKERYCCERTVVTAKLLLIPLALGIMTMVMYSCKSYAVLMFLCHCGKCDVRMVIRLLSLILSLPCWIITTYEFTTISRQSFLLFLHTILQLLFIIKTLLLVTSRSCSFLVIVPEHSRRDSEKYYERTC